MADKGSQPKVAKVELPDVKPVRAPDTQRGYTAPPPPKKDTKKK